MIFNSSVCLVWTTLSPADHINDSGGKYLLLIGIPLSASLNILSGRYALHIGEEFSSNASLSAISLLKMAILVVACQVLPIGQMIIALRLQIRSAEETMLSKRKGNRWPCELYSRFYTETTDDEPTFK